MGYIASRRKFISQTATACIGLGAFGVGACKRTHESVSGLVHDHKDPFFKISLAEWSLHRSIRSGKMTNLDFPLKARQDFGIDAVEYVSQLFPKSDDEYVAELKGRAQDAGVKNLLIMIDGEGNLGDPDETVRNEAVQNHTHWVQVASTMGCHSIRVNASGDGDRESVKSAAVDGLGALAELAAEYSLNIIVENHGGYSSDGEWLSSVMREIDRDNCGTLPDFGNFCIESGDNNNCAVEYDKYKGVEELMPFAFGVSAKSYAFDENGNETKIDYYRMLTIVKEAGYDGYVGIEFEGDGDEDKGIRQTLELLRRVGASV